MATFIFKEASVDDIPVIIELQSRIWFVTYRDIVSGEQLQYMFDEFYSEPGLKQQFADGQRFFLLNDEEQSVGFASFTQQEEGIFKLNKIYVLPRTQKKGYGRFLLDSVEQEVKQAGGRRLRLNVNRFNTALSFYEKMGYAVLYEEDVPVGPYWMNDYVMSKDLV